MNGWSQIITGTAGMQGAHHVIHLI